MKAVSVALLFLFALFALSTKPELTTARYVYDTQGNPLVNGSSYYASLYIPNGGPVKPAQVGNDTEAISVVLGSWGNPTWPVKFIVQGNETRITTNSSLDIEFLTAPANVTSTQWSVGPDYLVRIDSEDQALNGTFKITNSTDDTARYGVKYQIEFLQEGGFTMPLYYQSVSGYKQLFAAFGARILPFVFYPADQESSGMSAI
ncbi:hypothetical protein L6164_002433 [Bauhinia variegata]|uniref:Uncharacterized protein n=1 Tax=Bauhinia variegata TaxID=167791 RepID=A0ACB9PXN0_BAUVA|nr:hypothetical protein L6164_002433 [Bauhinia variegata]